MEFPVLLLLLTFTQLALGQLNSFPSSSYRLQSVDEALVSSAKPKTLAEALQITESFMDQLRVKGGMPSLVFSVSVRGKTLYERAWGYADLENQVLAKLSTKYRIASISKTFTSTLLGTLVDRELLAYDDPLSKYVPASAYPIPIWKGRPVNVTLAQLLTHTAGTHLTNLSDFNTFWPFSNCTQYIGKFKNEPLHFEPGSDFLYSNYGYSLLGAVIESVTGKPFQTVMSTFVRQTLALADSFIETGELMIRDRARYYRAPNGTRPKENLPTLLFDQQFTQEGWWPSVGLLSTAPDLVAWGNRMLDTVKGRNDSLLSKATIAEILTKRTTNLVNFIGHPEYEYGYGWFISKANATVHPNPKLQNFFLHTGGLVGISSILIIYPEEEIVIAAITNKGDLAIDSLDLMAFAMAENIYPFIQ